MISFLVLAISLQSYGCQQFRRYSSVEAQSQQDYRFASGHSATRIPFEEDDGHIFLQVRINNSDPLWFGLDTGAIRSIIDKRYAASLGLKSDGTQQIEGVGGYEEGSILKNVSIKIPGVELYHQTVWALPLDGLSPANGREIAGIIGYELFNHFVVDIDFVARQMNLYEPRSYVYRGGGQSIPLLVQPEGEIYVQAKVAVPNHDPIEGQFVIDTGDNNSLMLARPFVEQHRLLESVGPTHPARGGGVGGEIQLAIGRVKSLQLGNFVIQNPITGFMIAGEIADRGKAGNIGGRLLRRFRVVFDYSRRRMMLEPNQLFSEPDESDMSGAALSLEAPDFKLIRVARVRPNSPAAVAGLMPQDVITAVDGRSITGIVNLRHMFREDGREYLLTIKRGDQVLQIKIKLRRLI